MSQFNTIFVKAYILALSSSMMLSAVFTDPVVAEKENLATQIIYRPALRSRGSTEGGDVGGKRGCSIAKNNSQELLPIVPKEKGGLSASINPTIWIYSPYITDKPLEGELRVRWSQKAGSQVGDIIKVNLPKTPGFFPIKITLPLDNNKDYSWSFTVKCGDPSANPFVVGWLQIETNPRFQNKIQALSVRDQSVHYAGKSYWYDAFTLLASQNPPLKQDLTDLLQSAGVDGITSNSNIIVFP
jgi:hypothetical protein